MSAVSLISRREALVTGAGLAFITIVRPARAAIPATIDEAIHAFTNGAEVKRGKVKLDIPPLVENGNSAPMTVKVDSPMTAEDHVKVIAVFNEKNPQPNVANFYLSPRSGRAEISARIRLATTQQITAIARLSDGSYWSDAIEVIVTIAACTEE
ncbi:SoxY-related AACIE arm protein [Terrarubrum flagellatum]|uniref:SoxY-related AACIE arm protein n=1 Tax=Terrirubrum flagellatum TaxID=2895980 RepID=UPI00314532B1